MIRKRGELVQTQRQHERVEGIEVYGDGSIAAKMDEKRGGCKDTLLTPLGNIFFS